MKTNHRTLMYQERPRSLPFFCTMHSNNARSKRLPFYSTQSPPHAAWLAPLIPLAPPGPRRPLARVLNSLHLPEDRHMRAVNWIRKKRDGHALTPDEIE